MRHFLKIHLPGLFAIFIGFFAFPAVATTYYVDVNSPNPTPPYNTWATASTDIQSAVNQTANDDLVLVNPGVYQSGGYMAPDGTLSTVVVSNSVTLQSVAGASSTFINGSGTMRGIYLQNNSVLMGFTITNGTAGTNNGGGIYCPDDNETVSNCVIVGNLTYGTAAENEYSQIVGWGGGGVFDGTLYNCLITNDSAPNGVGGGASGSALNNCIITGNEAYYGGGVYQSPMNGCSITNNTAAEGGGILCIPYGNVNMNNCVIAGNTATNSMGAGGVYQGTLNNCLIISNSAPNGDGGGASYAMLNNCVITCNEAEYGGGVYTSTLNDCWITNNIAYEGGGSMVSYSPSYVNSCLIAGNSATVGGGAAGFAGSLGQLINCTVANNTATSEEGGIYGTIVKNTIIYDNASPLNANWDPTCVFYYCCTTPSPGGAGNITNAPLFANEATGNFQLQSNSPCINAGNNAYGLTTLDLAGNPRIIDVTVDMGAYEYQPLIVKISAAYANIVMGFPLQLQATVGNGTATFSSWNFGDGVTITNQLSVQHSWSSPGVYIVALTVSNNIPTQTTTAYFTINVLGPCYVNVNGTDPIPPYYSWATAATNIQDAVNAAAVYPGGIVLVTNGIYQSGGYMAPDGVFSAVMVTNAITVESVNGTGVTSIDGSNAMRCIYLGNNSALVGFTITNGTSSNDDGGGIYCQTTAQTVSNCVVIGNSAYNGYGGGGVFSGKLFYCLIVSNSAPTGNGGGDKFGILNNCILAGNSAASGGGSYQSAIVNCTLDGNSATIAGGGMDDFNVQVSTIENSIIYNNTAPNEPNSYGGSYNYCCTIPLPSGPGDITNAPLFVNEAAGDFQLQSNSPCINAGNNTYATTTNDFAGNPRIVCGTVDMGVYEYQTPIPMTVAISATNTTVATLFPWQLQAIVGNGVPTTIFWNFGDGTTATNQLSLSHSWISPGIYPVTVTVSNPFVPQSTSASLMINVYQPTMFYVAVSNRAPAAPYVSWATAATSIQGVVNYASPGSLILVSNGLYNAGSQKSSDGGTNRIAVTNAVTVQSVNGPAVTIIQGGNAMRCVYLTNGAVLNGFTLTSGNTPNGGGIYCSSTNAQVLNSTVINNTGYPAGGIYSGTVSNCTIMDNSSGYAVEYGTLYNCLIISNAYGVEYATLSNCSIFASGPRSGGAYNSTLYDCIISNNTYGALYNCQATSCKILNNQGKYGDGDPGSGADLGYLTNCIIAGNVDLPYGTAGGALGATLINCLIVSNAAEGGGGASSCTLINCTVVGNFATSSGGGTYQCRMQNCIVCYNTNYSGSANNYETLSANNCCTVPLPSSGFGNFTNAPLFVNLTNNFQLQPNSPCINSGNNAYVNTPTDLAGNPRIVGGTVDIGAYEYQTPTSVISYAWLQQYGLPTDGSVDFADLDGSAFNVYQDWVAGLNPTNNASVLAMLTPTATNNAHGITVTWQSVSGISYNLLRSTNLPAFTTLQSNITGQPGTTSYTDTSATNNLPYFYRVSVLAP